MGVVLAVQIQFSIPAKSVRDAATIVASISTTYNCCLRDVISCTQYAARKNGRQPTKKINHGVRSFHQGHSHVKTPIRWLSQSSTRTHKMNCISQTTSGWGCRKTANLGLMAACAQTQPHDGKHEAGLNPIHQRPANMSIVFHSSGKRKSTPSARECSIRKAMDASKSSKGLGIGCMGRLAGIQKSSQ